MVRQFPTGRIEDQNDPQFRDTIEVWFTTPLSFPANSSCVDTHRVYISAANRHLVSGAQLALALDRPVSVVVDNTLPIRGGAGPSIHPDHHMKRLILALALLAFGSGARAAGDFSGKITLLHFYEGHTGVLVKLDNMADTEGCGRFDWFIVADTHPHYKDIYALLLGQKLSGNPVRVLTSGCVQGIPNIIHVFA